MEFLRSFVRCHFAGIAKCQLFSQATLFSDFDFTQEIKNAKQQVEQEQTQTNVEMTLLSQDDSDVNREDAPVT